MRAEHNTFDDLVQRIGELGKYQVIQFNLAGILISAASIISLSMMFVAATPSHMCSPSVRPISVNFSQVPFSLLSNYSSLFFNSSLSTSYVPINASTVTALPTAVSFNFDPAIINSSLLHNSPLDLLAHQISMDLGITISRQKLMTWFIPAADAHPIEGEVSSDSDSDRLLLVYRYSCCTRFVYGEGEPVSNQSAYNRLLTLMRKYLGLNRNFSNVSLERTSLLQKHEAIHRFIFSQNVSIERCNEWIYSDQYYYSTIITKVKII